MTATLHNLVFDRFGASPFSAPSEPARTVSVACDLSCKSFCHRSCKDAAKVETVAVPTIPAWSYVYRLRSLRNIWQGAPLRLERSARINSIRAASTLVCVKRGWGHMSKTTASATGQTARHILLFLGTRTWWNRRSLRDSRLPWRTSEAKACGASAS